VLDVWRGGPALSLPGSDGHYCASHTHTGSSVLLSGDSGCVLRGSSGERLAWPTDWLASPPTPGRSRRGLDARGKWYPPARHGNDGQRKERSDPAGTDAGGYEAERAARCRREEARRGTSRADVAAAGGELGGRRGTSLAAGRARAPAAREPRHGCREKDFAGTMPAALFEGPGLSSGVGPVPAGRPPLRRAAGPAVEAGLAARRRHRASRECVGPFLGVWRAS